MSFLFNPHFHDFFQSPLDISKGGKYRLFLVKNKWGVSLFYLELWTFREAQFARRAQLCSHISLTSVAALRKLSQGLHWGAELSRSSIRASRLLLRVLRELQRRPQGLLPTEMHSTGKPDIVYTWVLYQSIQTKGFNWTRVGAVKTTVLVGKQTILLCILHLLL